jgi:prepilin-type N-terminal cleavage/methylation domain-containing protein
MIIKERIELARATSKGFTLIEILIVVAIIAILASVVLVGLGPTQQAGRDARRLSDLHETQTGLELYYNKCGYYPGTSVATPCGAYVAANTWAAMSTAVTGAGLGVSAIPTDPSSNKSYYYGTTVGGTSYIVAAVLENPNNSVFSSYQAPSVNGYTVGSLPGNTCADSAADPVYCVTL